MRLLILVVDDEPDVEVLFRQRFRQDLRAGRFTMEFAQSGPAALQRVSDVVDVSLILILSDINMPRRVGVLMGNAEDDTLGQSRISAFRQALHELGWTEGRNLKIELCWSGGDASRVKDFAAELIKLAPDVISEKCEKCQDESAI